MANGIWLRFIEACFIEKVGIVLTASKPTPMI
jgi:hypothetical protein